MAGIRRKKVKVKKIPEGPRSKDLTATFRSPGKAGKIVKKSGGAVKRKTGGKVKVKNCSGSPISNVLVLVSPDITFTFIMHTNNMVNYGKKFKSI